MVTSTLLHLVRVVADVRAIAASQVQTVVPLAAMYAQPPWMHSMMAHWPYGIDMSQLMRQQHDYHQLRKIYETPVIVDGVQQHPIPFQPPVQTGEPLAKRGRNDQGKVDTRAQGATQGNTNLREDFKRPRHNDQDRGPRNRAYDQDRNRYNNSDRYNNRRNNYNNNDNNGYRDRYQARRNNNQDSDRRNDRDH
jgi:hypothetical protein